MEEVERAFVDDPAGALDGADRIVAEIMEERSFPTVSCEEARKSLGVMHSDIVEDFCEAQRVHQEGDRLFSSGRLRRRRFERRLRRGDLEKRREAIQKYRSVYEHLTKE